MPERQRNPESIITDQIRNTLRLLHVPHFKHWSGPMSEQGISDIVGVIPGGRALFIEIKTPTGKTNLAQELFLSRFKESGALAFVARSSNDVINKLAEEGYLPAVAIAEQLPKKL